MNNRMLLLKDVAKQLGKRPHQIVYPITSGQVPEPELRVDNKRIFQPADVARLKKYFYDKEKEKKQ